MRCCGLTNYGRRELILCTVLMLLLAAGAAAAGRALDIRAIGIALAVIPLAVWIWVLWFFRDPQRATPAEPGLFIAPADGCVTDITPLGPQRLLGREGKQIGIS